jgi:integrase
MRTKYQKGNVYAARKRSEGKKRGAITAFHIHYYITSVNDGLPVRVLKSEKLCDRDDRHFSATCPAVSELAAKVMARVNTADHQRPLKDDLAVSEFYERHFLPYCEEKLQTKDGEQRYKPSTVRSYKQIWKQHLKGHFASVTLQRYDPDAGTQFLASLTGTQCKTTLKHITALGYAIFKRAFKPHKLITANTWENVEMPEDAIDPKPTKWYTVEEAEAIIEGLDGRADCQLIMALACFFGLRPGEIAALKWSDAKRRTDGEWLHIERSFVRGKVGSPKTPSSVRDIPLIPRVRHYWDAWREERNNPSEGWVFPNAAGDGPVALHNLEMRVIRPILKEKELIWKSLYAGRRGACTFVIEATEGNYAIAQQLLGHKSMSTTLDTYKKAVTPAGMQKGMAKAATALKQLKS